MINRSAGESAKVARLHAEYGGDATTFFFLLLAWLDVEGNVRAADWWLKGNVCPEVAGLSPGDCQRFARGLAAVGLAVPYEVAGKPYLHLPGFRDEQPNLRRDRERPEVPPFPQVVADSTLREVAGQPPGNLPATAGQLPARAAAEVEVEVEVKKSPSLRSGEKKSGRGTQLPTAWEPNETHARIAAEHRVDLGREAANYRDHATAHGRVLRDWDAGFRTWLRKAIPVAAPNGARTKSRTHLTAAEVREQYGRPDDEKPPW